MKMRVFNSTLSCMTKCIRFVSAMINIKIILGLFLFCFLGACSAPTAMLGPAYTLTSTGNIAQAGFSYGSNVFITNYTGKSPMENMREMTSKKNIQKKTLESDDFYQLVKIKIEKNKGKIILSNQ